MLNKLYDNIKNYFKINWRKTIFLLILIIFLLIKLPYVIYAPGKTIDLTRRITSKSNFKNNGSFEMAYVTMYRGNIPVLLLSYLIPNWDIDSNDSITYEDETVADAAKRDKIYMKEAIDNATISAYRLTDKKITIESYDQRIVYISKESKTNLKIGDTVIKVNGQKISSQEQYSDLIKDKKIGDRIELIIRRNNRLQKAYAYVQDLDGPNTGIALVSLAEYNDEYKVKVQEKNSESGPSGGLIMALAIYNELVAEDITYGHKIVGTGAIDKDGNVEEIGGIKYKIIGAHKQQAEIFICPKKNYKEALKVIKNKKYQLKLIGVNTLSEAIEALNKLYK